MTSGESTKVLLIEDNPDDARLIREMLSEAAGGPFAMQCEETLAAGLERLVGEPFDVLLLDLSLPDSRGLDTLRAALERVANFPVVVLTGLEDSETARGALDLCAQDYLVKGRIDADSLERSIRYALARHRSEEALRDREEHYRRLVEGVGDAILTTDLDLNITSISPSVERSTGYTAEEVLGRNTREFITAESFQHVAEALSDNLARQKATDVDPPVTVRMEVEQIRKDGSAYPAEISAGFLRDQGGAPYGIHVVSRDITDRRRLEDEREVSNQELERRVMERTAQLQALNKEMESFAYSVSHDLRTPLRAVDGFARMLIEEHSSHLDEEGLRLLSIIRQNSDYMAKLIEHLLMLSRVDKREPAEVEVDMNALARQVAGEYQSSMEGRSLEFTFEDLPPARGDPVMWRQVWENLLANAVKFTRNEDRAQVKVGCLRGDGENVYFVKDNGAGFDMQYADRLFGIFRRLHSPEEYEGVGVGLALVQRIVRRHGGKVWAEGKPGEGATFFFTAFPVQ